jgi:MoaA/NifB/PqqE/SkfB family radical SAM enzyme
MNKTFCTLPWVNVSVDPDGSVKPCCISNDHILKEDGSRYNLGYDKLEDIYNSKSFMDVRQKMIEGVEVNGCTRCYEQEKISGTSHRLSYNNFKVAKKTSRIDKIKIQYFDLRFGNLCNLKCRTCNSTASSQIAKEVIEIKDHNIREFWHPVKHDINAWYQTETFQNNLESQLDHVSLIYLTGGEPTLNEENKRFLQKLVDNNRHKFVTIKISTNMTNLNKEFFRLLSNFQRVIFFASIDGFKETQEYLRYPSNWNQIDDNIQQVLSNKRYKLIPTPVIQIGNLNNIVDLFEYFESFNRKAQKPLISIDPILLEFPEQFNIKYLPKDYKMMCWNRIETWYNEKCKYQGVMFKKKINGIKSKCLEDVNYQDQISKYKYMNNILDNHRNHHLANINKELYDLLTTI